MALSRTIYQHGMEMEYGRGQAPSTSGVITRAVVIQTYFADDPSISASYRDLEGGFPREIKAVSASVLTYGRPGRHAFLPRVPVVQARHGLNDHQSLWIPRPTTVDLSTGNAPILPDGHQGDREQTGDPTNFDGEHVLVTFIDNDSQQPIIIGSLPHPRANYRMVAAEGEKVRSRFRGVESSIDQDGNVLVETYAANSGAIDPDLDGLEPPVLDSTHGNVSVNMSAAAELNVRGVDQNGTNEAFRLRVKDGEFFISFGQGATLVVNEKDANAQLILGDGTSSGMLFEAFQAWWNTVVVATHDVHLHPSGMGPTGPPAPLFAGATDPGNAVPSIASDNLKLPTDP
ncbi:MAG TPA: hypothetical protein VM285_04800 [Polyangia bacterium]|nr:hypothetical protein [Polyangia bacterium]